MKQMLFLEEPCRLVLNMPSLFSLATGDMNSNLQYELIVAPNTIGTFYLRFAELKNIKMIVGYLQKNFRKDGTHHISVVH